MLLDLSLQRNFVSKRVKGIVKRGQSCYAINSCWTGTCPATKATKTEEREQKIVSQAPVYHLTSPKPKFCKVC